MAKITAAYPALNGGVSQKPERALRLNQVRAMQNMIYDPIMGLTRRPGLQAVASRIMSTPDGVETLSSAATKVDAAKFLSHTAFNGTDQLTVYYRSGARPAGSLFGLNSAVTDFVVVNQTASTILSTPLRPTVDAALDALTDNGVGAITSVGDLVVMASNAATPTATYSYPWADPSNQRRHLIWVRGGAYSRSFRLSLVRGNTKCTVEYTTLEASYPKVLDTSDLLPTDPDYSKKVNDRTNAYNSEATAWIAAALIDIAPENIAAKLAAGIEQSGFLSPLSTVTVVGTNVTIDDPSVEEVEADDGGDGNLIRAVGNVVGAPELLSIVGYPGKIVKVRPGNSERGEVFYLKARAKDGSFGTYSPVTWEEAAGEATTPGALFVYIAVVGSQPYISSDIAWINAQTGRNYPLPSASLSGDLLSNAPPEFFGKVVTALGVFKDRLVVACPNGGIAASQPGDYLNFFRQSVVTVSDSDPVGFTVIGAEGDTVRHMISYDQNLVLVGESRQYALPARAKFTPVENGAVPFSAVPGMQTIRPVVVSDSLFFAKFHNGYASIHTLRPGRIQESPQVHEVTENVGTYIGYPPSEVVTIATPDLAVLRTAQYNSLYVVDYFHIDGEQRYAIHDWDFPMAGDLVAIADYRGSLRALWVDGSTIRLEKMEFQKYSEESGPPTTVNDAGRTFTSRVTLVSPRFSPEAGNITGSALGANGYASQKVTVASMRVFFADTKSVSIQNVGPRHSDSRLVTPKEFT